MQTVVLGLLFVMSFGLIKGGYLSTLYLKLPFYIVMQKLLFTKMLLKLWGTSYRMMRVGKSFLSFDSSGFYRLPAAVPPVWDNSLLIFMQVRK